MKKKNPNDATFRNINALKKRMDKIEKWVEAVSTKVLKSLSDIKKKLEAEKK